MIDLFDLPYLASLPSPKSLLHFGKLGFRFGSTSCAAIRAARGSRWATRLRRACCARPSMPASPCGGEVTVDELSWTAAA